LPATPGASPRAYRPHTAVPILDPASAGLSATQVTALHVVRLDRHATSVRATGFGAGASRPAVDAAGRFAFIRLAGNEAGGGGLWVASALENTGQAIVLPGGPTRSAAFAPEPGSMVIGEAEPGGVWLLDLESRHAQRLSADGWQASWLP
jgi:hypothetical protein